MLNGRFEIPFVSLAQLRAPVLELDEFEKNYYSQSLQLFECTEATIPKGKLVLAKIP